MGSEETNLIESVFAGSSEMAARMRALDWSATPLGPVEQWPLALRTIVRVVLGSGYPMCILWGLDYVWLYNDAYRPMIGAKHPWALGRGAREVGAEAWDFVRPLFERVMTQGQDATFLDDQQIPLNRADYLEEAYFAVSLSPIPDDSGRVGGVLSTALETTQRVLEERRRQALRDLASRTAGARSEAEVWRVSAETLGEHRLNLAFAFLYEYRPQEYQALLAGASVETSEVLRPAVIDCVKGNLWRFNPTLEREGVLVELGDRASGVSVPNWPETPKQACVAPIRLGEYSEPLGFLVAGIHPGRAFDDAYRQFVLRVTEQITIGLTSARGYEHEREKLRASEERLEETSRLYLEQQRAARELQIQVDLLQQLPVSAWTLKPDGTPDFVNRVWLEFAGQTLDFVRSRPEAWMTVVHPDDRERITRIFWEGVSTGRGFVFENRDLRAEDGTYRWHLQQAVPLRDAEGNVLKFVGTTTDIDDQKRVQEALTELDRAKTTFFSNVSHEFRTPLTLMLGPLEEVQREATERLSIERREQLTTVHRNALRLLKLVNTLLDFSRIEAGRMQASYQPTDLATFTTEIASAFDSAMQNAGLRFTVECQSISEPVYVDRDMWEKIILNLLSNAYKFTFEGEVALALKPMDGAVELQISDTGVGIPEEHRGQVFERFHRIENTRARTYEGTGIGLALVQELVKLHGGSVHVESTVGAGSAFTVTIPLGKEHLPAERIQAAQPLASTKSQAKAYVEEAQQWVGDGTEAAADAARRSPVSSPEPMPATKRELIVLADDNADMRQYLTRLLNDRYEVHAVADGHQALEAARELRPSLVLADVMMPRLDGFGLLRTIREDSTLAGTPVILLSARAGEESRVEGLEADADDYLIKPFAARELLARVAAHVKMNNLRRETAEREERLRSEAELEREKLRASEERLVETSRLYRELQQADAELQLQVGLLQQLPVSAWTLRPDGTPDFVNQVWLEFAGHTLDFVRSHPEAWMTAVHPEDREFAAKSFWEGVNAGQGFAFETRSRRASDGVYRWHLQQAVVLRDAEGKVLRFVGTTTDIEDQKRAEVELRASETNLQRVIDAIPTLSWCALPDGPNVFLSKGWYQYTGFSNEQALGWGWQAAYHPEDLPRVDEHFRRMLASGEPGEVEARLRRHDGIYRWFLMRAAPFRDEAGAILRWYGTSTDIEDRKRAEEAVLASERNLSLAISTMPVLAWIAKPDGSVEFVNERWLNFSGLSASEADGWGWTKVFHPEDLGRLTEYWLSILATGEPGEVEVRQKRFDGEYRWFLIRANPLRDESGAILRWYGTNTDIQDRKLVEEALRASEISLRQTIDTIPGLVAKANPNGMIEHANQQLLKYFGKTAEEMNSWSSGGVVHPDDLARVTAEITDSFKTGSPFDSELRYRRADGVYRWFQARSLPFRGADNEVAGWYFLLTDIEDRKRAEAELRRSEAFLAQGQSISKTGTFGWSVASGELYWSEETYNIVEHDRAARPSLDLIFQLTHPDDRDYVRQTVELATRERKDFDIEHRLLMPDGRVKHVHIIAHAVNAGSLDYVGAVRDVTERMRAEEALRQAQGDLARINRVTTMGELTASLAHELSQPMSGAMTNAKVGLRKLGNDSPNLDEVREAFARIVRDTQRATEILGRIRSQFEKTAPKEQTLDVNEMIQETVALLRDETMRHNISVRTELAADLAQIAGDRVQMQQVAMNLIVNSIEAMKDVDGMREMVIRSQQAENDQILVSISDTGVGIPQQLAEQIFDPFFTTKAHGTGMGLRISRSIVESHGGRLWAAGSQGRGATFHLSLPAATPEGR
jgi:PAS domain S-box-containing protein